jgi:hypothetical protein
MMISAVNVKKCNNPPQEFCKPLSSRVVADWRGLGEGENDGRSGGMADQCKWIETGSFKILKGILFSPASSAIIPLHPNVPNLFNVQS